MEKNKNEQDEQMPNPPLNGQNMDRDAVDDSQRNKQMPKDGKRDGPEETEHTEWPFSKLRQQISDRPDGGEDDTEIKEKSKEKKSNNPDQAINRPPQRSKGNGHL
jgi:hypothetical protein